MEVPLWLLDSTYNHFSDGDDHYVSCLHYMICKKAEMFGSNPELIETRSINDLIMSGRTIRNYDDYVWKEHRMEIMKEGYRFMFADNPELKDKFISMEIDHDVLIKKSSNPYDIVWGFDKKKKRGENLLGKLLTELYHEFHEDNDIVINI